MPRYDQDEDFSNTLPDGEEELPDSPEGEEDPEGDPLEGLDDDTRKRVEDHLKAQTRKDRQRYGSRLARALDELDSHGIAVTDRGVAIRDPARFRQLLGEPAPAAKEEPQDDFDPAAVPDMYQDPAGFAKYVQTLTDRAVAGERKKVKQLEQQLTRSQLSGTVDAARAAAEHYGFDDLVEHPDFEERFTEALLQVPSDQWGDRKTLGRVLGLLAPDLREEAEPGAFADLLPERGGRKPAARETPAADRSDRTRAAVNRAGLAQIGASRGSGRTPAGPTYTEQEKANAQLLRMTPAEYRALKTDDTGESYHKLRSSGKKR